MSYFNMNSDLLFNVILFSDIQEIVKILSVSLNIKRLNNNYLWGILCGRDYKELCDEINKYVFYRKYDSKLMYSICHKINEVSKMVRFGCFPEALFLAKRIDLNNKKLRRIPGGIKYLHNLEVINFSNNNLPIPVEFMNLYHIEELNMNFNQIVSVPRQFAIMSSLKNLYLQNNNLVSVPKELAGLPILETLVLSYNQLKHIHKNFAKMPNLKYLHLSNNNLIRISRLFAKALNLKYLSVKHNFIEHLPRELLESSIQLVY